MSRIRPPVAFLFALPEIAWELFAHVWLIVKGCRPAPSDDTTRHVVVG